MSPSVWLREMWFRRTVCACEIGLDLAQMATLCFRCARVSLLMCSFFAGWSLQGRDECLSASAYTGPFFRLNIVSRHGFLFRPLQARANVSWFQCPTEAQGIIVMQIAVAMRRYIAAVVC